MTTEDDLRYTFACASCAASFSISLARIPAVQTRFSCPRCGKSMDFPSRDEVRVSMGLKSGESAPFDGESAPFDEESAPFEAPAPPAPEPESEPQPERASLPPVPAPGAPPPVPSRPAGAPPAATANPASPDAEKRYAVDEKGFENDSFDRRAMSKLIRTAALNESDQVRPGAGAAVRAADLPELKALFELRKTSRSTPPPVCRKHMDVLAHYQCSDSGRSLCDACAPEKKFGGTSVRVCDHCGGNARDLHAAPGDLS